MIFLEQFMLRHGARDARTADNTRIWQPLENRVLGHLGGTECHGDEDIQSKEFGVQ